jgi:hypothetical protein
MRCGFERSAHRVLVVSIEKRKRPVSGGKCEESQTREEEEEEEKA